MALMVMRLLVFECDEAGCDEMSEQYAPRPHERPSQLAWSRAQAEAAGWTFEWMRADHHNPKSDPNRWARCPAHSRTATAPEPAP